MRRLNLRSEVPGMGVSPGKWSETRDLVSYDVRVGIIATTPITAFLREAAGLDSDEAEPP